MLNTQTANVNPRYAIVDSHLHYLDFLQSTDGLTKLTEALDSAGVPCSVLFGMPMVKMWDEDAPVKPSYYMSNYSRCYHYSATDYIFLKHLSDAPQEVQARFLPIICGVNVSKIAS